MDRITLAGVIPAALSETVPGCQSDIWGRVLSFDKGRSVLIRAASGHGKTTLCCFLSGLRSDYSGTISFDGRNIRLLDDNGWSDVRCRQLAVMYQDLKLMDELSAVDNILLKTALFPGCHLQDITDMLQRLGIDDATMKRPVNTLSLGQQQRVAFVRMLVQPAQIRVLDEPVSHLDPENASIMAAMLEETCSKDGSAVIVTSTGYDLPYRYDRTIQM